MDIPIKVFAQKVKDMRTAQQSFFIARKKGFDDEAKILLGKSKQAEREVDLMTDDILRNVKQAEMFLPSS